jgi:hypothetical protein
VSVGVLVTPRLHASEVEMCVDRLDAVRVLGQLWLKEDAALREYCHGEEHAFAHTDQKAREWMSYIKGIKEAMNVLMLNALAETQNKQEEQ